MPGPTIDQARAFCAVAETRSYKGAAAKLPHSALSVMRLTERFAVAVGRGDLFASAGRGEVALTAAGRELLPATRRFVTAADALLRKRAEIRFSAYPSIVQQVMAERSDLLDAEVPLILVDVSEESRGDGGKGLVSAVGSGRLDLAVAPSRLLAKDDLRTAGLRELPLYRWQLRIVLPDGHPLRTRPKVAPADLTGLQISAAPRGHRSRELLERAFDDAGVRLEVALESDSQEMLDSVARNSNRHAAVIPDDAFGAPDKGMGPYLTAGGRRGTGGEYSLYLRGVESGTEGDATANRELAVARVATEIQAALRRPDPRVQ
jgi:DNA-binding transcriptional LysR family regulator